MKTNETIRQGDVLVRRVQELPEGATEVAPDPERGVVLAYGEVTGHAHVLTPTKTRMWEAAGQRYIDVVEPDTLRHTTPGGGQADHEPHSLAPGVYEVLIQREYHPDELRSVAD
jgi:hypothetical protein